MTKTEVLYQRLQLQQEYLGNNKPINEVAPVVSVHVTTYHHARFIRECLDGILMQQTSFPFEIVIGEDESTDGTREICIDYAKRFPDKIRLFLRDRSLSQYYENGVFVCRFNGTWTRISCRGKYIALCEGDDYWTDPLKLQKQYDYLEAHPDCVICHHNMRILDDKSDNSIAFTNPPHQKPVSAIEDLAGGNFISTASCFFRNGFTQVFPEWAIGVPLGDYVLHLHNALHGNIGYIPDVMGVYRVHSGGVWAGKTIQTMRILLVSVLELLIEHFDFRIHTLLREQVTKEIMDVVFDYYRKGTPDKAGIFLSQHQHYLIFEKALLSMNDFLKTHMEECGKCRGERQRLEALIEEYRTSSNYRAGTLLLKPYKIIFKYISSIIKANSIS